MFGLEIRPEEGGVTWFSGLGQSLEASYLRLPSPLGSIFSFLGGILRHILEKHKPRASAFILFKTNPLVVKTTFQFSSCLQEDPNAAAPTTAACRRRAPEGWLNRLGAAGKLADRALLKGDGLFFI